MHRCSRILRMLSLKTWSCIWINLGHLLWECLIHFGTSTGCHIGKNTVLTLMLLYSISNLHSSTPRTTTQTSSKVTSRNSQRFACQSTFRTCSISHWNSLRRITKRICNLKWRQLWESNKHFSIVFYLCSVWSNPSNPQISLRLMIHPPRKATSLSVVQ